MLSKDISIKKRILLGIASTAVFYTLLFLLTKTSVAQPFLLPATSPVTPVTPPTSETPTPTPGDNDGEGKATGGVTAQFGGKTIKLSFNAQDDGVKPKGNINYTDSSGDKFKGDVDICYEQSGNKAIFVGTVDEKKNVFGMEEYFVVEVQDNGEGAKSSPDRVRVKTYLGTPDCTFSGVLPAKVIKGNLQVH